MIPENEYYKICDRVHFLFSYAVILTVMIFSSWHSQWWTYGTIILLTVGTAIKEFWYDQNFEPVEIRGSNLRDFLGYLYGNCMAMFTLVIWCELHKYGIL